MERPRMSPRLAPDDEDEVDVVKPEAEEETEAIERPSRGVLTLKELAMAEFAAEALWKLPPPIIRLV